MAYRNNNNVSVVVTLKARNEDGSAKAETIRPGETKSITGATETDLDALVQANVLEKVEAREARRATKAE